MSKPKRHKNPEQTKPSEVEASESSAAAEDAVVVENADAADDEQDLQETQAAVVEEVEVLDPVEAMQLERDAFEEKWLRAVAEMDNLRKRSRRELIDSRRLAQAEVLRPILGVMDNFERALQHLHETKDQEDFEKILEGVDLIFQNFQGVLKDLGAVPMEVLGREFDPVYHDAVGQLPREGVESGMVIEVVQNGFMFQDQVLRPARVIISS